MKFLLIPNTTNYYDYSQLSELGDALRVKGHDVYVFNTPIRQHHADFKETHFQKSGFRDEDVYKEINSDVIIEVNRLRSKFLKKNIRHVSWFQDVRPSDYQELNRYSREMLSDDLLYLLGDKKHFGFKDSINNFKCLLSGTIAANIKFQNQDSQKYSYDINLLGYFSEFRERPPISFTRSRWSIIFNEILRRPRIIKNIFLRKTKGINLDIFFFDKFFIENEGNIRKKYKPLTGNLFEPELNKFQNFIDAAIYDYLYTELPRKLDRLILFQKIQILHKKGKQVVIAGKNWAETYPGVSFVRKHLDQPNEIYKSSKITIHNNTHGLGIHSRVLESMAAGGFVMMHGSPNSALQGGIDSTFEPEVNYGLYSADNFIEKAEEWLQDDDRRKKAITENIKILLAKHLWEHRAEQILKDLK